MANKPLQSIKFPGLSDTYIVPQIDSTLTQAGQAADAKVVGEKLTDLKSAIGVSIQDETNALVMEQGKYINAVGTKSNGNSFILYGPIDLVKGQKIYFNAEGYETNVSVISKYSSGTYTPIIISSDNFEHSFEYLAQEEMQVVLCSHNSITVKYKLIYSDTTADIIDIRADYVTPEMFQTNNETDFVALTSALSYAAEKGVDVKLTRTYIVNGVINVPKKTRMYGTANAELKNCGIKLEQFSRIDGFSMSFLYVDNEYIQDYDFITIEPTSLLNYSSETDVIISNIKLRSFNYQSATDIASGERVLNAITIKDTYVSVHGVHIENINAAGVYTNFMYIYHKNTDCFINSIYVKDVFVTGCINVATMKNNFSASVEGNGYLECLYFENVTSQAINGFTKTFINSPDYRFSTTILNSFVWDIFNGNNDGCYFKIKSNYGGFSPTIRMLSGMVFAISNLHNLNKNYFKFYDEVASEDVNIIINQITKSQYEFYDAFIPFQKINMVDIFADKTKNYPTGIMFPTNFSSTYQGIAITPNNLWVNSFKTAGLGFSSNGDAYIIIDGVAKKILLEET